MSLLVLLLLPFGMISIFSLFSFVFPRWCRSNCCRIWWQFLIVYSAYRIVFYPARQRIVVAFPVFLSSSLYWRYAVTRVWRRVLQASLSRSSCPQAIKKSISCHIGFFTVQDFNLSWTFSSPHFSSKTLVSRPSHVLPRTFFGAAILKQFSFTRKLNYLLQVV